VQIAERKRLGAYLVIECKYAPTAWVLFRGRPQYDEGGPNLERITTTYGEEWLQSPELRSAMEHVAIFHQEPRVGYALATTNLSVINRDASGSGSRDHDLAYLALLSATKASRAYAMSLSESETTTFGVVFPIVVVRGKLFEAWLDGEEPVVKEIRRGQVYWSNPAGERPTIVDIVADDRGVVLPQQGRCLGHQYDWRLLGTGGVAPGHLRSKQVWCPLVSTSRRAAALQPSFTSPCLCLTFDDGIALAG
jgi:hypothetical protein